MEQGTRQEATRQEARVKTSGTDPKASVAAKQQNSDNEFSLTVYKWSRQLDVPLLPLALLPLASCLVPSFIYFYPQNHPMQLLQVPAQATEKEFLLVNPLINSKDPNYIRP